MTPNLNLEDKILTLRVPADLISTNAESVRGDIRSLLDPPEGKPQSWQTFRLDLSAAKRVDSVGLNLIVAMVKAVQRVGAKMQVVYSDPNVHRTILFTRLDKYVEVLKA